MRSLHAVLIAIALFFGAAAARADEKEAMALYKKGEQLYNKGKYKDALAAFRNAYKAEPVPGLLFNIGQCLRKLGEHEAAVDALERYLRDETDVQNRQEVEDLLAEERAAAAPKPAPAADGADTGATAAAPPSSSADAADAAPAAAPLPSSSTSTQPDEGISPVVWVAVGGAAFVAVVGGAIVAAVALTPPAVPPTGTLGTVDFR